ncbi:MAG: hypothetical protein RR053_03560 [Evtepia sp.]
MTDPLETPETLEELETPKKSWSAFVEGEVSDFFTGYKLEKMTIEDGNGNKAKFSRTRDYGIKIEYTSTMIL